MNAAWKKNPWSYAVDYAKELVLLDVALGVARAWEATCR